MAARRPVTPLDSLSLILHDVVVTTGKAFRAARRDGKGNIAEAVAALETRIPANVERFNAILDDLECEILRAKGVFRRDLNLRRVERNPPPPEQKPVAPPAPMAVDLESPKMAAKEPPTGVPGASPSGKEGNKPVAPFPNMGFESTSPEVVPTPSPKTAPKSRDPKTLAKPAVVAVAAGRPASAPPKKDLKLPPSQAARPSGVSTAPQTPQTTVMQLKAPPSLPPAQNRPPAAAASNAPGAAVGLPSAPPPAENGNLFTNMTFSLAPPPTDVTAQKQAVVPPRMPSQQQQAQPPLVAASMEPFSGGPADVANMDLGLPTEPLGEDNVDAKIDGLFDLGPADMEDINHDYDFGNGDNSNFNDMYFAGGDSSAGAEDLDDAFFNLNG